MRSATRMIRCLRREPHRARVAEQRGQTGRSSIAGLAAQTRDPVVAATGSSFRRVGPRVELLDESVLEHPLNSTVQRARTEPQLTVGSRADVLHDRVAVTFAVGDGEEDVKCGGGR